MIKEMVGWLNLDYFRCEPFELNFRMLVFGGFWPLETNDKKKQILFSIFSYLSFFSLSSMFAIQCLDIYLLRNDISKLSNELCTIPISLAIVIKSYLLLFNIDLVNQLKEEMIHYKRTRTDPEDLNILEKSNEQILYIVKIFYATTIPCVIIWIIYPGFDSSEEKSIPFPYILPVEEWTQPIYIGVYTYHAMAMLGFMINVLSVDSIFCGFVLRINAHYNIIIKNFKNFEDGHLCALNNSNNNGEEGDFQITTKKKINAENMIKENIKLHMKILHELDIFGRIYKALSLAHIVGITIAIGAVVLDTVVLSRKFKLQILQRILYMAIALWDIFLYCYCASKLQEKSIRLGFEAYSANWIEMKKEEKRDLFIFLMKCQKAPKIYVGKFFPLELHAFVSLLKISYDVTAVLYQTTKK